MHTKSSFSSLPFLLLLLFYRAMHRIFKIPCEDYKTQLLHKYNQGSRRHRASAFNLWRLHLPNKTLYFSKRGLFPSRWTGLLGVSRLILQLKKAVPINSCLLLLLLPLHLLNNRYFLSGSGFFLLKQTCFSFLNMPMSTHPCHFLLEKLLLPPLGSFHH